MWRFPYGRQLNSISHIKLQKLKTISHIKLQNTYKKVFDILVFNKNIFLNFSNNCNPITSMSNILS